jgi:hypothetical protein
MYDQSFNYISLSKTLKKNDFYLRPWLRTSSSKDAEIQAALQHSDNGYESYSFLDSSSLRGKNVYRIPAFSHELVLRKIDKNLRKAKPLFAPSRDTIIANLRTLISESAKFKLYRLDIKSFYESFSPPVVLSATYNIKGLSPQTKKHIKDILEHFSSENGAGLPRGMALSATLSEIVMSSFDAYIKSLEGVYFYSRYVDDIIIITSGQEHSKQFINKVSKSLPTGLHLNNKKQELCFAPDSSGYKKTQQPEMPLLFSFEYLGYSFHAYEPPEKNGPRKVILDIANSKVKKIKTRLTKAYLDYCKTRNFELLEMRLKFLTSNFSVLDINRGGYRLSGIYHNYHRIDKDKSVALDALDEYLRLATTSGFGKVFERFFCCTTVFQRRRLLTFSFKRGFSKRNYFHFNRSQFKAIRECWEYA